MRDLRNVVLIILGLVALGTVAMLIGRANRPAGDEDKKIEAAFREAFADNPGLLAVKVDDSILSLEISDALYRSMMADKIAGKDAARTTVETFRRLTGKRSVTVWFYRRGHKVIEADTTALGEVDVEFLDD